jgi:glycosyltransferase involved in cell wall biosynthesis
VAVERYTLSPERPADAPYLCLGQLVGYKRVDLAVRVCAMTGRSLVVAGEGEEWGRLRSLAGPTVRFVGRVDDRQADQLYGGSRALIFPGEEDFGMVPVEAQAAGCPVIAYARGGALETVRENETGLFFAEQSEASLLDALERFEAGPGFAPDVLREQAGRFAERHFQSAMRAQIEATMESVRTGRGRSAC